jgi:hypothetical protein
LLRKYFPPEFAFAFCSQQPSSGPSSSSAAAATTREIPGCPPSASSVEATAAQNQRIHALEEELEKLRQVADNAKASAAGAAERERFILNEISEASSAMMCKLLSEPPSIFRVVFFAASFLM